MFYESRQLFHSAIRRRSGKGKVTMARIINARRIAFSQRLVIFLVLFNYVLIGGYAFLFDGLSSNGNVLVTGLLVFYNILLSWLVIHRTKRKSDRFLVYTMTVSILLLSVTLATRVMS